jgi:hypothetical protein
MPAAIPLVAAGVSAVATNAASKRATSASKDAARVAGSG